MYKQLKNKYEMGEKPYSRCTLYYTFVWNLSSCFSPLKFCIFTTRSLCHQMPLARAALYAQGTNLHVAHWPGTVGLTKDITRFVAMESRSFVISASNFLRKEDIPEDFPLSKEFKKNW